MSASRHENGRGLWIDGMTDFFTSDLHFGHTNILKYCGRPFSSVEEMNSELIRRWNSVVNDSDTTYLLGDFALGPKDKWRGYREALNGRIVICYGNHDRAMKNDRWMNEILNDDDLITDFRIYGNWDGRAHLAHIPVGGDSSRGYERAGMTEDGKIDLYLCGHVHDAWTVRYIMEGDLMNLESGKMTVIPCINVGVDVWQYQPRTLDEILSVLS